MSKFSPGIENNYNYNGEVWVPNSRAQEFGYTDGDEAEERISESISGCDDVSLFRDHYRNIRQTGRRVTT